MAMRESVRSLRWYFVLAGALSCYAAVRAVGNAMELPALPASWALAVWFPILSHLVLGAAFIAAGVKLAAALAGDPTWIQRMLMISGAALVIELVLLWLVLGDAETGGAPFAGASISRLIGLAITAYLYANVRRLANEAKASPSGTVFD